MWDRLTRKKQSLITKVRTQRRLKRITRFSESELDGYLDKRWVEVARTAVQKVPFYREHFQTHGYRVNQIQDRNSLRLFPLIDKSIIQADHSRFLNEDFCWGELIANVTAGSTGNQFEIWAPHDASAIERVYIEEAWSRVKYRPGIDSLLALRGRPMCIRTSPLIHYNRRRQLYNFSVYMLDQEKLREILLFIQREKIRYIHTYPSTAEYLVSAAREMFTEPQQLFSSVQAFLLASETVRSQVREFITRVAETRVFSHYGHAEHLILAPECELSSNYHVFPDYGLTELLDENAEPISPGRSGELVGTTLLNTTMPLIRYRTGDWATPAETDCSCGRGGMHLTSVIGKFHTETVFDADRTPINMSHLLRVLQHTKRQNPFENFLRFQFHQNRPGVVILLVVPHRAFKQQQRELLQEEFDQACVGRMKLVVKVTEKIDLEESGKTKLLVQNLEGIVYS